MSEGGRISRLAQSDKRPFVAMMNRAFAADPLFVHLFGEGGGDAEAGRRAEAFVSFIFDLGFLLNAEVWGYYEGGSLRGAYVVEKPRGDRSPTARGLRLVAELVRLTFRTSLRTLRDLNACMRTTRAAALRAPHHYLIMIGVQPEAQGRGIGTSLLRHLFARAEEDGRSLGIALDTEHGDNVSLYRKHGFELRREARLGRLAVYCMFRPAGRSGAPR